MPARRLGLQSFVVILVLSGFMNALQARANGELTQHLGNGVQAAFFSFVSGLVGLTVALSFSPSMRAGLRRLPPALRTGTLAWWAIPAGVLGGLFIACQSYSVAIVGVALFSVGMVAGQTASSVMVDRVGLSPTGRTPLTIRRLLSSALATIAVVVAVSSRLSDADLSLAALSAAFIGGCLVAVQQALNGRITVASQQPVATTWLNFVFGSAVLAVLTLAGIALFGAELSMPVPGPFWMYLGGVFGLIFIVTASWAVPRYGVLVFALVTIAGQLTAALVLDLVAPVGDNGLPWTLVVGVVLTFAAVALGAVRRR